MLRSLQNLCYLLGINPVFNFFSALATLVSISLVILPTLIDPSLAERHWLDGLDRIVLGLILLEILMRLAGDRKKYLFSLFFWIDLAVVGPLLLIAAREGLTGVGLLPEAEGNILEFSGSDILDGVRILRMIYFVQFFYLQRQMGLSLGPMRSSLKGRIFLGVATIQFFFIIASGIAVSTVHANLIQIQKKNRFEQIAQYASDYGIQRAYGAFRNDILHARQVGASGNFEITGPDFERVKTHYVAGADFEYVVGVIPGGTLQISYRDLNRRQKLLELAVLLASGSVLLTLLFSLNYFLNQLILAPVDRAMRVCELRMHGEELETSQIDQTPYTEITALVNRMDATYQKMRAPRPNPYNKHPMLRA